MRLPVLLALIAAVAAGCQSTANGGVKPANCALVGSSCDLNKPPSAEED